jgi:putative oxidoreductase
MKFMNNIQSSFDHFLVQWGQAILLALVRCYVAWQFLHSGLIKIQNWPGTLELFRSEYQVPFIPPELAAYVGTGGELIFPCLLIVGLFSRPAAVGLFFVNGMAAISYPQLWELECPTGINDHFYWGILLLVVTAFGAGRFSLDSIAKKFLTKT